MKETPLSNCERLFLLQAIAEKKRVDGRQTFDYRNIKITFGTDYGCCIVELGKTKVLAQVSCELVAPKSNRPTEGVLFFNLELSPMASPSFEPGRHSELLVKLNRLLERCFRNSKCIDTESLCVVSGEKVWQIRVDLHLLNHDGNIMDAASIAAITALCHFRRPDVSVIGEEVTVYSVDERDPVPLCIHHMPICVSFSFFQQGTFLLVDPNEREEKVMDGLLVIAMNKHREICTIQSSGGIMLLKEQVLRCSQIAGVKVTEITELIQKALENDKKIRKEGGKFGFAESLPNQRITAFKIEGAPVNTSEVEETVEEITHNTVPPTEIVPSPILWASGTAQIGEGVLNTWEVEEPHESEEADDKSMEEEEEVSTTPRHERKETVILSDSEEEEVIILNPDKTEKKFQKQASNLHEDTASGSRKKKKKKPSQLVK
ncbi:exosome complex component RRP45 isoform X1 [Erpetoichthys calabaricus]|uniref:Exosome complex component RRP45 n=1 Tax=Erpetoichthys calabaricus TaxID=27687 RepID=A0A8C4SBZ6_ERPCA|nr:exosome complex component RRP45 isoform X1 [Erpetoichthys calabaricus]